MRELEGAFTKDNAYSDIEETPITLSYAQKVLKCEENSTRPDIDNIVEKVSDFYNITNEDIKGTSRVQNISNARSVVCYIAREKLQYSYESIANALNKRHQTVMYSSDKIKKAVKNDKNLEKDVNKIIKSLSL